MTIYAPGLVGQLEQEHRDAARHLRKLIFALLSRWGPTLKSRRANEYLAHGVCRRVRLIKRCLDNVFRIFPPGRQALLPEGELPDPE